MWAERALIDGEVASGVRISIGDGGLITGLEVGRPERGDGDAADTAADGRLGFAVPGFVNAHSHAFHRLLRGRTHGGGRAGNHGSRSGGDFWSWRERMYRAAAALDPDRSGRLARLVFGEMAAAGWTTVAEFHYVHHRPDGSPYAAHDMELALVEAAESVGIRLVLLDTLYLHGGVGRPLEAGQRRFSDGSVTRWLERRAALAELVAGRPAGLATVGAALHSVRAIAPDELAEVAAGLPGDVPLHVHLSEQPAENAETLARYGRTPTRLLADAGLLAPRLSVVHATHLSVDDVTLLGEAEVTVVMCPTTEADLADGIGPARRLADAGCRLAVGSDQNAVVDPLLELRGLEAGERLRSGRRGRFSPAELWAAGTGAPGTRSPGLRVGAPADLVDLDLMSARTAGSDPLQSVLTATAADVRSVVVGGRRLPPSDTGAGYAHLFSEEWTR